jgi:hypothetical protein
LAEVNGYALLLLAARRHLDLTRAVSMLPAGRR